MSSSFLISLISLFASYSAAQTSCSSSISPKYPAPSVAPGFHAQLIANGLQTPRQIIFDSSGHLLVVESGKGITALTLNDAGGSCISVKSKASVIGDSSVSIFHGLTMELN
jgi:glucose/arabinose dehydrogenase